MCQISEQAVATEYATKYLERIGAQPNKAVLSLVKKNAPLTEVCVKTNLKVSEDFGVHH